MSLCLLQTMRRLKVLHGGFSVPFDPFATDSLPVCRPEFSETLLISAELLHRYSLSEDGTGHRSASNFKLVRSFHTHGFLNFIHRLVARCCSYGNLKLNRQRSRLNLQLLKFMLKRTSVVSVWIQTFRFCIRHSS